jgi:hypothetical protein
VVCVTGDMGYRDLPSSTQRLTANVIWLTHWGLERDHPVRSEKNDVAARWQAAHVPGKVGAWFAGSGEIGSMEAHSWRFISSPQRESVVPACILRLRTSTVQAIRDCSLPHAYTPAAHHLHWWFSCMSFHDIIRREEGKIKNKKMK